MFPAFIVAALAASPAPVASCPTQPEPAALASAAFEIPASGDTLLFSAAPSSQSVRYALRVTKSAGAQSASASLRRLKRRSDCNVHDLAGEWQFNLSPKEARALFAAASALELTGGDPADLVLDGTQVELQLHASGTPGFVYASNGLAKEKMSQVVLDTLRRHVPARELPREADWRFRMPGASL